MKNVLYHKVSAAIDSWVFISICILSSANWAVFGCYISSKINRNETNQIEKFMVFVQKVLFACSVY